MTKTQKQGVKQTARELYRDKRISLYGIGEAGMKIIIGGQEIVYGGCHEKAGE
jgi:hypothetical protein